MLILILQQAQVEQVVEREFLLMQIVGLAAQESPMALVAMAVLASALSSIGAHYNGTLCKS